MGRHDEKIEFRCEADQKRRVLKCREPLGTLTISDTCRALLDAGLRTIEGLAAIGTFRILREISVHLERIAGSLRPLARTSVEVSKVLAELSLLLTKLTRILDNGDHRSAPSNRDGERRPRAGRPT